jgi:hypothetical protein
MADEMEISDAVDAVADSIQNYALLFGMDDNDLLARVIQEIADRQ